MYSKGNLLKKTEKINFDIGNTDWATTTRGNDVNEKFSNFHDKIMAIIDCHTLEKSVPIKPSRPFE